MPEVIEYEGSDRVKVVCHRCGFLRWLDNPSTERLLRMRCACERPKASRLEES